MRAEIDPQIMGEAFKEWQVLRHGQKAAFFGRWLPDLGISRSGWYAELVYWDRQKERKRRSDAGRRKLHPGVEDAVRWIMRVKYGLPTGWGDGTMTTADALDYCLQNNLGAIPPEVAVLPEGTLNRIARELKLMDIPAREVRFQAERPNQIHQIDASGSNHLFPVRQVGGEWILKLRRKRQKNREKFEGMKVWYYGLVDDFSRMRLTRCVVAPGESALDNIRFLKWAWSTHPEHAPFRGIPEGLHMDRGAVSKFKPFTDFCKEIEVAILPHAPYSPKSTGKVENRWRWTWKRFENQFGLSIDWAEREICLTELNEQLFAFVARMNQQKHPYMNCRIQDAWLLGVKEMGGLVDIDPGAWNGLVRREKRPVDGAGCLDFKGAAYQIDGLQFCEVIVYQGVLNGGVLLAKDPRDGKKYELRPFTIPLPAGQYQGTPKTELQKLLADPDYQLPPSTRYDFREVPENENVLHLPPRVREVRESGFDLPQEVRRPEACATIEDLSRGVEVVERSAGGDTCATEQLFATPLERYKHLLIKEARGETLTREEVEFMAWFRDEYQEMLAIAGAQMEQRARLAVVE